MGFDISGIFVAGLLTFASPCILPLVPVYLGMLGQASSAELRGGPRLVPRAASFALGLAVVFVALGLGASGLARLLSAHRPAIMAVAGAISAAFGLRFLGLLRLPILDRERRPWLRRVEPGRSLAGAFLFGGAFALGWTPCVGPVLGAVLTYAASAAGSAPRAAAYLAAYAAGIGLPLVGAAAFAGASSRLLASLRPHLRKLEVATGFLLIAAGILFATDRLMLLMPRAATPAAIAAASTPGPSRGSPSDRSPGLGESQCTTGPGSACATPDLGWAPSLGGPSPIRGPAVVEVASTNCPICRAMAPVVEQAERGCPVKVVQALVEEPAGADLARRFAIRGVPTFLVLDARGGEMRRLVGQQTAAAVREALELVSPRVCDSVFPFRGGAKRS